MRTSPPELTAEYRRRGAWADTRITDLFDTAVRVNPSGLAVADAPNRALLCGDAARRLSFTELQQLVSQYLLRFVELGLERGHILITQLPNIAEYTAVYLAALKLGVILSPVPIQFGRGDLEKVMRLTDARALLTVAKFKGAEPALDAMAAAQGLGVQVLVLGDLAAAGALALAPRPVSTDEQKSLEAKVQALGITADDIATICWTSGTEGVPKGVPRSHNHWLAISPAHFRGASIRRGDVLLNPFPLVNMAALGGCFLSWLHAAGLPIPAAPSIRSAHISGTNSARSSGLHGRRARPAEHAARGSDLAVGHGPIQPTMYWVGVRTARSGDDSRLSRSIRH